MTPREIRAWAMLFLLGTLALVAILMTGCSSAPVVLQTNTLDTVTTIRPERTEVIPLTPAPTRDNVIVLPPLRIETVMGDTTRPAQHLTGHTKAHDVDVDLVRGTATITDHPDTAKTLHVGRVEAVAPQEPGFFSRAWSWLTQYLASTSIIAILGVALYLILRRTR